MVSHGGTPLGEHQRWQRQLQLNMCGTQWCTTHYTVQQYRYYSSSTGTTEGLTERAVYVVHLCTYHMHYICIALVPSKII